MKKLIGAMAGCIVAYYALDAIGTLSMATAWRDLVEAKQDQAANALNDVIHTKYCERNRKFFDFCTDALLEGMKEKN